MYRTAVSGDPSSVPSTRFGQHTSACKSITKGLEALCWPPQASTHMAYTQTQENTLVKILKEKVEGWKDGLVGEDVCLASLAT